MSILLDAAEIVEGARQKDYGSPLENWSRTAAIWSAVLSKKLNAPITPEEAVLCMIGVKLARLAHRYTRDSLVDIPGYAEVLQMIRDERDKGRELESSACD